MRCLVALAAFACALAVPVSASAQDDAPPACQGAGQRVVDWQACLDALPPDSGWRALALINLGTEAFMREDYAAAVQHYDAARPSSGQMYSDILFHTLRGAAYWRVGRREDAVADADIVHRMLMRDPTLPLPPAQYLSPGVPEEMIYVYLLPVWQSGDPGRFEQAVARFRALPVTDWISMSNRASVLQEIGDNVGALEFSARAVAAAPDEPAALNNHCYILLQVGRAAEGLPFCERAVARAPTAAPARHSLAEVLAALGRCGEAQAQLAEARRLDPATASYQAPLACTAN